MQPHLINITRQVRLGLYDGVTFKVRLCSARSNLEGKLMIMPKLTVSNYPEMLRKLSIATFFMTIGSLMLLRTYVHSIDSALMHLDVNFPNVPVFGPIKIPFGTFLVAFVVAAISKSMKLHDKISDALRIRSEFDIRWILAPMALLSGASLSSGQFEKMAVERRRLMGELFYTYASSTPGRQVIDGHTVTQALTTWSWYWLCVEAVAIILPTAAILAYEGQNSWTAGLLAIALMLMLAMRVFWFDCSRYANSQVRQILNDSGRRAEIAAVFNAL